MNCRHCENRLENLFLDLGVAPPSNAYLTEADLQKPEMFYPLRLWVCVHCWLVQTEDYTEADQLFSSDYAYFSSTSSSWLTHARHYADAVIERLGLNSKGFVIEVACNDGYLLKNFVKAGIPCLGIEPTASTAAVAEDLGIPIRRVFFGEALGQTLAAEGMQADLLIANNVYAHVPNINDFTRGLKWALKPSGVITLEFPHLMRLIENGQFDTIYHEHFSYLSLYTVSRIFECAELRIFDVEELPTHGGSLRVYGSHESAAYPTSPEVDRVLDTESAFGLRSLDVYASFQERANSIKNAVIDLLLKQKSLGNRVIAYGAAAKGNTLLNYAGIKPDLLPFICDAARAKQGKYLPGSHIPILPPTIIREYKPDLVLVVPWNIVDEIVQEFSFIHEWGGRFVTAVPGLIYR